MPPVFLKNILVALDGSDRSMNTVRHMAESGIFYDSRIVLLSVLNSVPESFWDHEREPQAVYVGTSIQSWQVEQKRQIEQFMNHCRDIFIRRGHAAANIDVRIQARKRGIARDVLAEAAAGYDAVVIRRRGFTLFPELVTGSVFEKLLRGLTMVPTQITGQLPENGRLLIGFDGSADAMHTAVFVAGVYLATDTQFTLLSVLRGENGIRRRLNGLFVPAENQEEIEERITRALSDVCGRMTELGVHPSRIETKIVHHAPSRSQAIFDEAESGNYNVIALGRRGKSTIEDFCIGRVSRKVIQLAPKHTVWLVG